jgi:demethylmenaquinone methyltransferase/2-methoxy-6-polyprenyl-1,4-benzoquinol methylase
VKVGATPAGINPGDEIAASRAIRDMFGRVAPRYDLLNRLLSLRIDQRWRNFLVRKVRPYLERPDARVADLCCGTGDLLIALEAERRRLCGTGAAAVTGSDFCRPMLTAASEKLSRRGYPNGLVEADAMRLPWPDEFVDLITIAWGFRNLANYQAALLEFRRVIRPGGCVAILEFSRPTTPVLGPLFQFYFRHVLPRVGNALSGSGNAYSYLQHSVSEFPAPDALAAMMRDAGFGRVEMFPLTGGISFLHLGYNQQPAR